MVDPGCGPVHIIGYPDYVRRRARHKVSISPAVHRLLGETGLREQGGRNHFQAAG